MWTFILFSVSYFHANLFVLVSINLLGLFNTKAIVVKERQ